jgi:hypothetical protein
MDVQAVYAGFYSGCQPIRPALQRIRKSVSAYSGLLYPFDGMRGAVYLPVCG